MPGGIIHDEHLTKAQMQDILEEKGQLDWTEWGVDLKVYNQTDPYFLFADQNSSLR